MIALTILLNDILVTSSKFARGEEKSAFEIVFRSLLIVSQSFLIVSRLLLIVSLEKKVTGTQ